MSGKLVGAAILISAVVAGLALYYVQIYAFYTEAPVPEQGVELISVANDGPEPIPTEGFQAIDADSSPIRYRACFTTDYSLALLTESFVPAGDVSPRNAPGWFDCFDAAALGAELKAGTAFAFVGAKNIAFGVDRIVAITDDGRGFIWHELNECGKKAYDGTIVGEECPALPTN